MFALSQLSDSCFQFFNDNIKLFLSSFCLQTRIMNKTTFFLYTVLLFFKMSAKSSSRTTGQQSKPTARAMRQPTDYTEQEEEYK